MASDDDMALEAARGLALAGDADGAIAHLTPLAAAGSGGAAASLAELLAFRGDWKGVVKNARLLLESPGDLDTANVFDDMVRLLGLAGHEIRDWKPIAEAARSALEKWEGERERTILAELAAYAKRSGAPPHERIEVFGVEDSAPNPTAYAEALKEHEAARKKKKPDAWAAHAFALANVFKQGDEMVRLFDENEPHMEIDHAIDAGRVLARRGELDRAWRMIAPRLPGWWPVDAAQVAPVVLVTDDALRKLATKERWEQVLATRRGPPPKPPKKAPAKKAPAKKAARKTATKKAK
jgi:hypothetical protein